VESTAVFRHVDSDGVPHPLCAHQFAAVAPSAFAFKTVKQFNVVVGAFIALSGYVAAFTTCEAGQPKARMR